MPAPGKTMPAPVRASAAPERDQPGLHAAGAGPKPLEEAEGASPASAAPAFGQALARAHAAERTAERNTPGLQPAEGTAAAPAEAPPLPATPAPPPSSTALASAAAPPRSAPQLRPAAQVAPVVVALALGQGATPYLTLRLDPGELGQVEVRIERAEGRPAEVKVLAERPETLALLQRDAPELGRALQQAGIPTENCRLSFSLTGGGGETPGQDRPESGANPGGRQDRRWAGGLLSAEGAEAAPPRPLLGLLDIAI